MIERYHITGTRNTNADNRIRRYHHDARKTNNSQPILQDTLLPIDHQLVHIPLTAKKNILQTTNPIIVHNNTMINHILGL